MPFIIQWVESCSGVEEVVKLQTPAGQLVIYSQQGVISKTDWELDDDLAKAVRMRTRIKPVLAESR